MVWVVPNVPPSSRTLTSTGIPAALDAGHAVQAFLEPEDHVLPWILGVAFARLEASPSPNSFLARTLNVYVVPAVSPETVWLRTPAPPGMGVQLCQLLPPSVLRWYS